MLRARKFASAALTASLVTVSGVSTTVLSAGTAHADSCSGASQIVNDINALASGAGDLTSQLGSLTFSSSAGDVQSAAQSTVAGLSTMINDLNTDVTASAGCPTLSSADSQTVANAASNLTSATQQMLSALTGQHSPFAQFGATAPIASSLRSLEAALDSYAFALTTIAAPQQGAITQAKESLDNSLGGAITLYEQTCIPSPLYPTIQPVCIAI
jgi:Hydrophobic surface binding protein A